MEENYLQTEYLQPICIAPPIPDSISKDNMYKTTRTETQHNQKIKLQDQPDEALQFTRNALKNIKDGDRVTVEYAQGDTRKTSRIDLFKGFTTVETTTTKEKNTTFFSLSGWKMTLIGLIIIVPWAIGMEKVVSSGFDVAGSYWRGSMRR